jgi:rubrerythrin
VALGPQAENDEYEVVSGLSEGEEIVTSGQFMLDSESQLREAIQKMNGPGREVDAAPKSTNAVPTNIASRAVKYICPMPEHVSIEYDHPGKCPICGMTLVPVTQETLKKLQPGGKLLYYTCPMPEHSDVHSDKPGKCPKCGMTLIPVMETLPNESTANVKLPSPLYTCEMHLDVVSDKPGKCFKCGMTLIDAATLPEPERRTAGKNWQLQHQH